MRGEGVEEWGSRHNKHGAFALSAVPPSPLLDQTKAPTTSGTRQKAVLVIKLSTAAMTRGHTQ